MMQAVMVRVLATRPCRLPLLLRLAAGSVFVLFAFGKFINYGAERNAIDRYGFPFPGATTYFVGALELVGGTLLLLGLLTRPAALVLAGNMIGAISTAGRIDGGWIHLGLAPALLITVLVLVWSGAGAGSLDLRLHRTRFPRGYDRRPPRPDRLTAPVLRPRSRLRIRRAKTERGEDAMSARIGNLYVSEDTASRRFAAVEFHGTSGVEH